MPKMLVIADDLTGANDTGALLQRAGYNAIASPTGVIDPRYYRERDVLSVNIDSRAAVPGEARRRVTEAVRRYAEPGMLFSKRIDSTLRGNVGSEIDGILDALPDGYRAVVVPSFPSAGRICVGGYILVYGTALEQSDAGKDPKTPIHCSQAVEIIEKMTKRPILHIPLKDVLAGSRRITEILTGSSQQIVVADAATQSDIQVLADGCVGAGIPFVCVDPGSFTLQVAKKVLGDKQQTSLKNLLVIGSRSGASRRQLDYFQEHRKTLTYSVDVENLLEHPQDEEQKALQFFRSKSGAHLNLCLTTVYSKPVCVDNDMGQAEAISRSLCCIAWHLLELFRFGLVYLCGGDIAKDFIDLTGAQGIDILDEVLPLAVYGKLIGGNANDLPVLTKGGMIGGDNAIDDMLSLVAGR